MTTRAKWSGLTAAFVSVILGVCLPVAFSQQPARQDTTRQQIDGLMHALDKRGQFSGAVLVGDAHGILYEGAFGQANHAQAKIFTTQTQSCLASVSKSFTALAVMIEVQDGLMRLSDPISKYVDGLEKPVGEVTIRQVLTHTSGIPDYGNSKVDHPGATTEEVLQALRTINHLEFQPGERYQYSNSGYVLLSAAVAKAAQLPFPQFVKKRILGPAGMKQTFILTTKGQKGSETAIGYNDYGSIDDYFGFVTGDGGMYSTVEDLYRFDEALYKDTLVSQTTLDEMFTPGVVRSGTTTYGLGWNVETTSGGKRVWHTGNTAGFRAYFERRTDSHRVIILLTNVGNSKRVEISAAINNILDGKPFTYPKRSGSVELNNVYRDRGIAAVLSQYAFLRQNAALDYDLSEGEINELGYQILYADHNAADAVKVLTLNTEAFPSSSNAFDSLAEADRILGDLKEAKKNYKRAVELDSTNEHARAALAQIK